MSGFVRRFTQDPGISEITSIEGVVIIDREPPGSIQGASTGVVIAVGEFEDGVYKVPTEVASSQDLSDNFGGFGFTYDGVQSQNPCARSRKADAALTPEYWNGNGFLSLVNKRFSRLIIARVDTSVGEVQFTRNPSVTGAQAFSYNITDGDNIKFAIDNLDGLLSPARITSAAGTYPTTFGAGTLVVEVDGGAGQTVTFTSSQKSRAQVIAKINADLGYQAASADPTSLAKIILRSFNIGPSASIEITAVTGVTTASTGFSVTAVQAGTDNQVTATFDGDPALMTSAAGTYPSTFAGGEKMTVIIDEGTSKQIGPLDIVFQGGDQTHAQVVARINSVLGYTAAAVATLTTTLEGRVEGLSSNVRITSIDALVSTATGFTVSNALGTGNVNDLAHVSFDEIKNVIEGAIVGTVVEQNAAGEIRVKSINSTANSSIWVGDFTATALGFIPGDFDVITGGEAGTIPAGTRVSDGTTVWVTASKVRVAAGNYGPYRVRVRPALDDGTAVGGLVGMVTTVVAPIAFDSFTVTNLHAIGAALTEAALDAAYTDALESTLNANSIARQGTLIYCARSSNVIRTATRTNALRASSEGLAGRLSVVRPPLGTTTRAMALSTVAQPGVGAYRDQRVVYAYPGAATFVPQIAALGLSGGAGFSADGIIDVGFDAWIASACSQLAPEENPGQLTGFMTGILSVERENPDVQDMKINDYKAFKAAGIAALRIDGGTPIIQSGVTSVDPAVFPNLKNIARRRMADFIQDSVAPRLKAFNKKNNTRLRRALIIGEIEAFMNGLVSKKNPSSQRIDSYRLDPISGNTPDSLAAGLFRIILKCRTLSSLDYIVFDTEIGENVVTIVENLAAAA